MKYQIIYADQRGGKTMKCELVYSDKGWEFAIEPETEAEKCALEYLAGRPKQQIIVRNTRLGIFRREGK